MKHPSKEMLQTSMPKLISEVAEALSMNKCYRQNIREIFYNYKNAVNVSKDLYTKVAEMLVQFEKKHDAEYFYSNYFSTIVKESEKYFLNIEKSASTLLASRLADKLQENKHKCTFQIPCTFVPNCGGRTQFLFFERSGTARPLLDSCFVTI